MSAFGPSSAPELPPRAEALGDTRETALAGMHLGTSDQRLRFATSLAGSEGTEKIVRGEMQRSFGEWQTLARGRIASLQLHGHAQALLSQFESFDHPIGRDTAGILRQLIKASNPDTEENRRLNPFQILKTVEHGLGYLQSLRVDNAHPALYPSAALLQQTQAVFLEYANAVGAPPQGSYLNNQLIALRPNTPYKSERYARTGTMIQMGGMFLLAPTAAALLGLAFMETDDDARAQRMNSGLLWCGALVANCLAHKLIKVGNSGNVELITSTDRWLQEIGFLGQMNGDYVRLAHKYNLREPAVRAPMAELAKQMASPEVPPEIRKLLRRTDALLPQEQEQILNHFAPGASPLRDRLTSMLQNNDFRVLNALFGVKRSEHAQAFITSFLQAGAGPEDFAALPGHG